MAGHYAVHIGIAPSLYDWISTKIQKYHYHGYASSPRTTAVHFVRFLSLNAFASIDDFYSLTFTPKTNQSRHIVAHLHSGYTYPHVLYVLQYSVFNLATIPAYMLRTSAGHVRGFFYPPPLPHHTFFEPFLLYGSECVIIWFVTVHDENSPAFPRLCVYGIPI